MAEKSEDDLKVDKRKLQREVNIQIKPHKIDL